jgi:hypothetical protein
MVYILKQLPLRHFLLGALSLVEFNFVKQGMQIFWPNIVDFSAFFFSKSTKTINILPEI